MEFRIILQVICILVFVTFLECAPAINSGNNGNSIGNSYSNNPMSIQTMVQRRSGLKNGDLDPQTRKDLKILNFFEDELNKIFSCYIRLSCPRTRNTEVIAECQEIKDWPLYHQVMKMAGIKRYPYNNFAPKQKTVTTTSTLPPPIRPTEVTSDGLSAYEELSNEFHDNNELYGSTQGPEPAISQTRGPRGWHMRTRRN